jgi:hypothetical protein
VPGPVQGNVDLTSPMTTVSWDADNFDLFVRSQGVKFVHWRAMPCPVGKSDRWDVRRTEHDHSGCSNGHIYTRAGEITCLFMGNGNKRDQHETGLKDGGTANATAPTTYDNCPDASFDPMPFDRLYLTEEAITVPAAQQVEAHATNHDRLDYPVVSVVDIVDSKGVRHGSDEYDIVNGQIVWKQSLGFDPILNRGTVYSIRYMYRPYWYIRDLTHQIRVAQVQTVDGRVVRRFPQQFVIQREHIFEKEEKDSQAPDPNSPRQVMGPRNSGFGPR